jgi:NAD(P)-dependent dehydrogenase (short-subunit alcohol dehydrogenase family)
MTAAPARKVAVVTAAGKGIGAAIARRLAADGWSLGLLSPSGRAETLAAELGGFGVTGSITDPADLDRLVDGTRERFGRLDAIVVNAGHAPKGELLALSDADWQAAFELLFLGAVRLIRKATPAMVEAGGGSVVVMSSFAAVEPEETFAASAAMRGALLNFAKIYADTQAKHGIRINTVLPGFVDSLPERPERRARIPLGRYARADEAGALVAFLLSDDAAYLTGQTLRLDGGLIRAAH